MGDCFSNDDNKIKDISDDNIKTSKHMSLEETRELILELRKQQTNREKKRLSENSI